MPRRTHLRKRRSYRRPSYIKRKRAYVRRRRSTRYPRARRHVANGIPFKRFVKLRYATVTTLDAPGTDTVVVHSYRANSIWDPDAALGGTKPMYADDWARMYNRFCVVASVCKARWVPASTGNVLPALFGIFQSTDQAPYAGSVATIDMVAGKFGRWSLAGTSVGVQANPMWRKSVWRRRRFFPGTTVADPNQIGYIVPATTGGSDPLSGAYFNLWAGGINAVDPASVNFVVVIEYYVLLWSINPGPGQPALDAGEEFAAPAEAEMMDLDPALAREVTMLV